ncbi:MAG: heavy metal sensor histidine kinase [Rhodocyclaceae bacterium]|nr:heavy metal sensor histidine kinase [Rhodocyclaceae bacterium]
MQLGRRHSITFRLTAWIASATTAILLGLGILIGQAIEQHFHRQDMALLTGKLALVEHLLEESEQKRPIHNLPALLDDALIGHHGLGVQVATPNSVLYRSKDGVFPQGAADFAAPDKPRSFVFEGPEQRMFKAEVALVEPSGTPERYSVTITTDVSDHVAFMRSFSVTLWTVVGLAALLAGFVVWYVARRELSPLKTIRAEAERITAQRLDRRISTDLVPVELVGLVGTLNDMLARLEEAFQRLSDFSSDLAHELRTPVTNLLTETQVSLSKVRSVEQYQDILLSNAEELERMARMISDMLFLAKSDNTLLVPNREPLDLAVELDNLLDFYEALATDKGIRLVRHGEATIEGDRLMLRRALVNLMSNAVRYTPAGEEIQVTLTEAQETVTIAVSNPGPEIPAEHLPRLFDRFYRVDDARQRLAEGTGLGLAIAYSIVRAHHGNIAVQSKDGITRFEISLPKVPT